MIERSEILERLVAATQEGFWLIDPDANTVDVNAAMCAILARPREEILGKPIFDFVDEDNLAIFHEQIRRRQQGETGPYEISLLRPDGSLIPCVNNATPIYDDDGTRVGSIGLWTDITDIKRVQRQLEVARDLAESANNAKSEFLASMSHELRTPLNAILGFAQLMEASPNDPMSDRQSRFVAQILSGGRHLLALIDQVLDLSRVETGAFELSPEVVSPFEVVAESAEMVRAMADARGIEVKLAVSQSAVVYLDRTRLRQVLLNLLSNAIKYNSRGGNVSLKCERVPDRRVRITVVDDGDGIPAERQREVFEPFNRLGREGSEIEGTGVGLVLTRRLVEAMYGDIGFTSDQGSGSTFWVEFPEYRDAPNFRRTSLETIQKARSSVRALQGRLLYVEDNPTNIELMKELLSSFENLELICVETGEGAVELARAEPPDLFLLDIHLPGMDGFATLATLRTVAGCTDVPAIALSAAAMTPDRRRGEEAGFVHYLTKPIEIETLLEVLSQYLGEDA